MVTWIQVDVYINLGDLYRAQGTASHFSAEEKYRQALRLDRNCASGYRGLGDLYREQGHHEEAVQFYKVHPFRHTCVGLVRALHHIWD